MFGSWSGTNTQGTGFFGTKGPNNRVQPQSYEESFNKTIAEGQNNGPNKGQNNGPNKGQNNGQKKPNNQQEEQSNFNPNNEGVFSIPIIKEFSNLNTKNIEIAEQEGMIGCNVC
jgi:hypothetical protein